jgi:2-oxoacid:acceptor oxidoreductase delta subunit (pyruvate/2-ketoisovalerate family)
MARLRSWQELAPGGVVPRDEAQPRRTGGWRTGLKPQVELSACVNCLLCWLYCPDAAVRVEGETFAGFDYDYCKGCELCAEMCPTGAITLVPEDADV